MLGFFVLYGALALVTGGAMALSDGTGEWTDNYPY